MSNSLLEGRFGVTKVVHIDRKDDGNEILDSVFDYSYRTVVDLMRTGYHDAILQMDIEQVKGGGIELSTRNRGWDNIYTGHTRKSISRL